MRARPSVTVAAALGLACGAPRQPSGESGTAPRAVLSMLAEQRVLLLPTQSLAPGDSLGWAATLPAPRDYLRRLDDEIAFALGERDAARGWVLPPEIARVARRSAASAPDPYALAVEPLRPRQRARDQSTDLPQPLASQVRTLAALGDARYALVPVELRFEPHGAGAGRAVLRLALLDARLAQVAWAGEVTSDPAPALAPSVAATVAARLADLLAAR